MLTLRRTDRPPIAAFFERSGKGYEPTGNYVYFKDEQCKPLPPKIRKLVEKHYGMMPPEGDEIECEFPI